MKLGEHGHFRAEGGYRHDNPRASGQKSQGGAFTRIGVTFDFGKGAAKPPATLVK